MKFQDGDRVIFEGVGDPFVLGAMPTDEATQEGANRFDLTLVSRPWYPPDLSTPEGRASLLAESDGIWEEMQDTDNAWRGGRAFIEDVLTRLAVRGLRP